MTREKWALKKRTWKEQTLRFEFPQATAEDISRWADTPFDSLPTDVKWGLLIRYSESQTCTCACFGGVPQKSLSCPIHGDGSTESNNPGADNDILYWYAAAAEARNK